MEVAGGDVAARAAVASPPSASVASSFVFVALVGAFVGVVGVFGAYVSALVATPPFSPSPASSSPPDAFAAPPSAAAVQASAPSFYSPACRKVCAGWQPSSASGLRPSSAILASVVGTF